MKVKKGLTLIEIILSIAILGIISLVFLTSIVTHFTFLNKSRKISQDNFLDQRSIEKEISLVTNQILEDYYSDNEYSTKIIFPELLENGLTVKYIEVEKDSYYTYVPKSDIEQLKLLKLDKIENNIMYDSSKLPFGYARDSFKIEGEIYNEIDNKKYVYLNMAQWYVSSDEFIMPVPEKYRINPPEENEDELNYYPLWPRDYIMVKEEVIDGYGNPHKLELEDIDKYRGKHIILAASPSAKSGKIGKQMVSKPTSISGLPVTCNLSMHLDAGFIDSLDTNQVDLNKIKKWIDLSSVFDTSYEYAIKNLALPSLKKTDIDNEFRGQYVSFNEGESLSINRDTKNKNIYIYAVGRVQHKNEESIFLKNGNSESIVRGDEIEGDWLLIKDIFQSESNNFIIGNSNVDIVEIVIYDDELTSKENEKLEDYFNNKYTQPIIIKDILSIDDINRTIKKGDKFSLPSTVLANMNEGYQKHIPIQWEGYYNANIVGIYKIRGISKRDPNKTMTYTLKVIDK